MQPEVVGAAAASTRLVSTVKCSGYRLSFEKPAPDGTGVATAVRTNNPGDAVWGVVWECDEADGGALDAVEGIGPGCRWHDVTARDLGGEEYVVKIALSEAASLDHSLAPSRRHRDSVVEAARQHGLPRLYVSVLAALQVADGAGTTS